MKTHQIPIEKGFETMSLMKRLMRIAKSNLHHVKTKVPGFNRPGAKAKQEPLGDDFQAGSAKEAGGRRRQNEDAQPSVDPEIAAYFANLEVPYGSDLETVRAAWKRLMRQYHPDLHGQDPEKRQLAQDITKGLNHAYSQLEKLLRK